jgi:hypothetical protein
MKDPDVIFALTVRSALIQLVRAIEKRYGLKSYDFNPQVVEVGTSDSISLPQNP